MGVLAVGGEDARLGVVAHLHVDVGGDAAAQLGVEQRVGDLHAVLGVARHHVGRAQIHDVLVDAEHVHAGMLEPATHDAANGDVFRLAGHAGQQARDAAHNEVDLHARAARLGDLVDDLAVGDGVHLEPDMRLFARARLGDLAVDAAHDEGLEAHGGNSQVGVLAVEVADLHVAEEPVGVLTDARVGRHVGVVGIEGGGLLVVVAGAQLRDARDLAGAAIGDLADLGVDLEARRAVQHGAAGVLKALRPLDVVLLVEAGAQLHDDGHVDAVFSRGDERLAEPRLLCHAVQRDLDLHDVGVAGRLAQQAQERLHRLVGVGEQDVVVLDLGVHGHAGVDAAGGLRGELGIGKLAHEALRDLALKGEGEVSHAQRARDVEHLAFSQLKCLTHELDERLGELALHFQANGVEAQALLEHALDVLAVVVFQVERSLVGVDVGVARDPDHRALGGVEVDEEPVGKREDDVFKQGVAQRVHVVLDLDEAAQRRGDLDDAEKSRLRGAGQVEDDVERVVVQVGEGVARVHDLGRDHGQHLGDKELLHGLLVLGGVVSPLHAHDAVGRELVLELAGDLVVTCDVVGQHLVDARKLLAGRLVRLVVHGLELKACQLGEAAQANHHELVEVALEDGGHLEALEQGHGRVGGLFKHTLVELQPRQLAVLRVGEVEAGLAGCRAYLLGLAMLFGGGHRLTSWYRWGCCSSECLYPKRAL